MANAGPDTNTSHFSILMAPAPHLDGHYTIFGEVVEGFEVGGARQWCKAGLGPQAAGPCGTLELGRRGGTSLCHGVIPFAV